MFRSIQLQEAYRKRRDALGYINYLIAYMDYYDGYYFGKELLDHIKTELDKARADLREARTVIDGIAGMNN